MENQKGILVVALTQRGKLLPAAFELLTAGRALADTLKEPLAAIVLGDAVAGFAQDLIDAGADKVFVVENAALANFNDELHTKAVAEIAEAGKFGKILVPASVAGRALSARLAVRLKAGLAAEATEVYQNGVGFKAKRSQYSGNIVSEIEFKAPVQVVSVQGLAYPRAEKKAGRTGEIVKAAFDPGQSRIQFVGYQAD